MSYLKGFTSVNESVVINDTRENLKSFFDYGLLEKGNIINVNIPSTGIGGGLDHVLRPVSVRGYNDGQVWQSIRKNWVWESGFGANVSNNSSYPGVSGVYVGGTFYPTSTTGDYSHYINHPQGRVVFNTAISTDSVVTCDYSYKYINVTNSDGVPWFQRINLDSERSESSDFINNSGEYFLLSESRYQVPAIGIELTQQRSMTPYQLGGGQNVETTFLFHCVAQTSYERDFLVDVVSLQKEKVFNAYNMDSVDSNNDYPLDYRGVPSSGAKRYPELLSAYSGPRIRIKDTAIDSVYALNPRLYAGTVRVKTESLIFGV